MNKMKIPLSSSFECSFSAKNGLKPRRVGIIQRMSFVARLMVLPLVVGMFALDLQAQVAPETPDYDPNTDPRIDRREHPNAPKSPSSPSPLRFGVKSAGPVENENPVFLAFAAWIQKYRLANELQKKNLLVEGIALTKERRDALIELIKNHPQRALEWAVSRENRVILPPEVQEQLETHVTGCGDYDVLIARPSGQNNATLNGSLRRNPPKLTNTQRQTIMRYAVIGGKRYKVHVFGWRHGLTTKYNIPLHGIAVDNLLALSDAPARVLEAGEPVPAGAAIGNPDRKCPLCGGDYHEDQTKLTAVAETDAEKSVIAQIGNIYYYFDNLAHLRQIETKLIQGLAVIGPRVGATCDQPLDTLIAEIKAETKNGEFFKAGAGNNGVPVGDF
jgi:hypothetical protein